MRNTRVPIQEQYRLIMECRQSGLTDHQWCLEHDIKPGTFYNWVKRLRQKGCSDLSPVARRNCEPAKKQEVVKVDFNTPDIYGHSKLPSASDFNSTMPALDTPAMKLSIGKCILSIPNGTDPHLLVQALRVIKEFEC